MLHAGRHSGQGVDGEAQNQHILEVHKSILKREGLKPLRIPSNMAGRRWRMRQGAQRSTNTSVLGRVSLIAKDRH